MQLQGDRLVLEGDVTAATVPAILAAGGVHLRNGVAKIDFGAVGQVDSAAIAIALEWLREADAAGRTLAFLNLPAAMVNLARLYDVADLLSQPS